MLVNMTIKARLVMLVSVIMTMSVLVMAAAYIGMSNLQTATEDLANRRITLIRTAHKMMYAMADNRTQILLATQHDPASPESKLKDHPITKHFDAIAVNKATIDGYIAEMEKNTRSEEGKRLGKEFGEARAIYVSEGLLPTLQALKAGKFEDAQALVVNKMNPLLEVALEKGHAAAQHENEGAQHLYESAMAAAHTTEFLMMSGVLLMLAVTAGMGYSIISGVSRATGEMRDAMTRMATDGDLSRRVQVHGNDEVAQAATAFNGLIDGFANIIRQVNQNAHTVASTAASLSASSLQIARGSLAQSESAAATAAAVEEITVSISSVAANTEDVRKLSEQSLQQTIQGNQSVSVMVDEIQRVQGS
ncbi:MAG: methyl-accepting chemotaxis protein, partial [Gallionella sp.]